MIPRGLVSFLGSIFQLTMSAKVPLANPRKMEIFTLTSFAYCCPCVWESVSNCYIYMYVLAANDWYPCISVFSAYTVTY